MGRSDAEPLPDVRCVIDIESKEVRVDELAVTAFFLPIQDPAGRR
jgi:hypothetical protein